MLFSTLAIPLKYQHRVLFWGIFGALTLRAIFIWLGSALITSFWWVLLVFGVFLIATGVKVIRHRDDEGRDGATRGIGLLRRFMPSHRVLDENAGVDRLDGHHLPGRGGEAEQIVEMDGSAHAGHRPERRREIEVGGREIPARGNLAGAAPVDWAWPVIVPLTSATTPLVKRLSSSGWRPGPKSGRGRRGSRGRPRSTGDARRDLGDDRPARRVAQRAGRADLVAGQREMHVFALQRIEARVGVAVGNSERAVDAEVAVVDQPAARGVAQEQRDIADGRFGAAEPAADPGADEGAGEPVRIDRIGDSAWPSRSPRLLRLNCFPTIWPPAAAR